MAEAVEERMMAEYAAERLTPGTWRTHVRLGAVPTSIAGRELTELERGALRVTHPEADLVQRGPDPGVATIVEFTVWNPVAKVGQLLFYGHQLPLTPGYEDVTEVHLRIVTGLGEPRLRELAAAMGIDVETFQPAWLLQKLASRRGRS